MALLANSKPSDDIEISLRIAVSQIVQEATPTANQSKQTTPAGVVLLVAPHVLSQIIDAGRQDRYLHFGGTGVRLVVPIILNQFLLPLFRDRHLLP